MRSSPKFAWVVLSASLTLLLTACTLPSKVTHPELRQDVPLAGLPAQPQAGWPTQAWWMVYREAQLDHLIDMAMQRSPDLSQAASRIQAAKQSARLTAAQHGLQLNGSAQVNRQRLSDHGLIPPRLLGYHWYNQSDLDLQLTYDFDWWGKHRNAVAAATDQAHAAEAERSTAALALQYMVADTYFGWQGDQARLDLASRLHDTQRQLLELARLRMQQGLDNSDDTLKAEAGLAATDTLLAELHGSAQIRLAVLASLLGVAPSELPKLEARPLPDIATALPANASLDLIARRPDIAASRWQVESALKQTEVARMEFLPNFSLSALAGLSSITLDSLSRSGSRVFSLAPAVHLPIFNSGMLQANYLISRARLDAAVANYQSTVQIAARDVATQALRAQLLGEQRTAQRRQLAADQKRLDAARARAYQGIRDHRESLVIETQWLQQCDADTQLHAQTIATDLALIKALGGGYRMDRASADAHTPHPAAAGVSLP